MTRLIGRLVLAMLILPTTGAVFLLLMAPVFAAASGNGPDPMLLLAAWAGVYAYIGAYWTLLWRNVVRWSRWRKLATAASAPAALIVGIAFGSAFAAMIPGAPVQIAILVGGGAPPIVWTLATVLIWRETPRERADRLASMTTDSILCPVCSYNLTGLREAACPECGSSFTLERLLAAQPARDASTLHDPSVQPSAQTEHAARG